MNSWRWMFIVVLMGALAGAGCGNSAEEEEAQRSKAPSPDAGVSRKKEETGKEHPHGTMEVAETAKERKRPSPPINQYQLVRMLREAFTFRKDMTDLQMKQHLDEHQAVIVGQRVRVHGSVENVEPDGTVIIKYGDWRKGRRPEASTAEIRREKQRALEAADKERAADLAKIDRLKEIQDHLEKFGADILENRRSLRDALGKDRDLIEDPELEEAQSLVEELEKKYGPLGVEINGTSYKISGVAAAEEKISSAMRDEAVAQVEAVLSVSSGDGNGIELPIESIQVYKQMRLEEAARISRDEEITVSGVVRGLQSNWARWDANSDTGIHVRLKVE